MNITAAAAGLLGRAAGLASGSYITCAAAAAAHHILNCQQSATAPLRDRAYSSTAYSSCAAAAAAHPTRNQQGSSTNSTATFRDRTARVLVTGAGGQIGSELVPFLRSKLGPCNVIASDLRPLPSPPSPPSPDSALFAPCDVVDKRQLEHLVKDNGVTAIVHLATLLSAVGERNPALALKVNTIGCQNVLELARECGLQVYAPSTIAVFGPDTPRHATPDTTVMRPTTMYGITKVHQELLGQYYADRYGVDFRGLRYPGIISALSKPGGGTTDYAVDIFHQALLRGTYTCFLPPDAELPMMYMPDCLEATWKLMSAPRGALSRCTYNITAASFTPAQLAEAIRRHLPHFTIRYQPDFRAGIAASWPASLDDSLARKEWGWQHRFDLPAMTDNMLSTLSAVMRLPAAHPTAAAAEAEHVAPTHEQAEPGAVEVTA